MVPVRQRLDARHLLCPLPVIRVQDRIGRMAHGEQLEVLCTDPGAASDVPAWCRINGHRVLGIRERDGELAILIEVGGGER